MTMLKLSHIRRDGGTQSRAALNEEAVGEYAELNGSLPAVIVYYDGTSYWLAEGFHRVAAAEKAGRTTIDSEIIAGSLTDAKLRSARSNQGVGVRRTNADKRTAVTILLGSEWEDKSDRWIAEQCGVTHDLVAKVRESYGSQGQARQGDNSGGEIATSNGREKRTGKDGKEYPATKAKPLCDRCRRVGAVKGCPACKDLAKPANGTTGTKAAPATNGTAPKDAPKDDYGTELPKHARGAFGDPWIQSSIDFLAEFSEKFRQQRLADGLRKRSKHYPFIAEQDFRDGVGFVIDYLDQLLDHLKAGRPSGVCPACNGARCARCKNSGIVPREIHKELVGKK